MEGRRQGGCRRDIRSRNSVRERQWRVEGASRGSPLAPEGRRIHRLICYPLFIIVVARGRSPETAGNGSTGTNLLVARGRLELNSGATAPGFQSAAVIRTCAEWDLTGQNWELFELEIDPDVEPVVEIAVHAIAVPTVLQASLLARQADGARPERPDAFAAAPTNARVDDAVGAGLTQDRA